jgi:hypothetical protein
VSAEREFRAALAKLDTLSLRKAWYRAFGEGDRSMTYDAITNERVDKLAQAYEEVRQEEITPRSIDRAAYGLPTTDPFSPECQICGDVHRTLDHGPDDGPIE